MAISTYAELKIAVGNWLGRDELTARIPEFVSLGEDRIARHLRVQAMETSQAIKWKAITDGGTVGGTANAITLSGLSTPALGDTVKFTAALGNTSTVTINTSYALKRRHGGVKEGLSSGDIVIGSEVRAYFDGTDFLLAPPGGALLPSNFVQQRRLYLDVSSGKNLDYFDPAVFWSRNFADDSGQAQAYTIEGDFIVFAPVPDGTAYGRLLYYRRFASLSSSDDTNWALNNARGVYLYATLLEAYTFLEDDAGQLKFAAMFEDAYESANEADRKNRFPMGALSMRSQVSVI